mgnify:CR=1 FL=1
MDWIEKDNSLNKTFEFSGFQEAVEWMSLCVERIEKMGHHPEWKNIYNKVFVKLRTHSAGNTITKKDRKLAELLDEIYCQVA